MSPLRSGGRQNPHIAPNPNSMIADPLLRVHFRQTPHHAASVYLGLLSPRQRRSCLRHQLELHVTGPLFARRHLKSTLKSFDRPDSDFVITTLELFVSFDSLHAGPSKLTFHQSFLQSVTANMSAAVPDTMKALKCFGPKDVRVVDDVPVPECPPDYMLVKVEVIALNPTDWVRIPSTPSP